MRASLRTLDPIGPLLALLAGLILVLHGFDDILGRDLGVYSYGAQQVVAGVPPYESVLSRTGPLAHLVPAVGVVAARLTGIDDVLGMRLLMVALSALAVWLLYLLGRDLFTSRLAGAVTATTILTFEQFVVLAAGGPRDKPVMLLFLTAALLAVTRRSWLVAGVAVALATLTLQTAFPVGLAAGVAGLAFLRGRALVSAVVRFTSGGSVTALLCAGGFWAVGALREFVDAFVLIPAGYTAQSGLLPYLAGHGAGFVRDFGPGIWLFVVGVAGLVIASAHRLVVGVRGHGHAPGLVAMGIGCLAALGWSLRAFNGAADGTFLMPFAAVGLGAVAHAVLANRPPRAGTALGAGVVVLLLVAGLAVSVSSGDDRLNVQRASVNSMVRSLPSTATILSVEAPQALVLSQRTNPIRHQMFPPGLSSYVDDTYPGGLEGLSEWVVESAPTAIAARDLELFPWLAEPVRRDYVRIGKAPKWTWYVHRSVGRSTVRHVRATHRRAMAAASASTPGR